VQNETPPDPTAVNLPKQVRRFILTVMPILVGLHVYIWMEPITGAPIGMLGTAIGWTILSLSALLIPMSMLARFMVSNPALVDRANFAGSLAMGLFSSLLVLTLLRGLLLPAIGILSLAGTTATMVILAAVAAIAKGEGFTDPLSGTLKRSFYASMGLMQTI
jgi:hypothetical protein